MGFQCFPSHHSDCSIKYPVNGYPPAFPVLIPCLGEKDTIAAAVSLSQAQQEQGKQALQPILPIRPANAVSDVFILHLRNQQASLRVIWVLSALILSHG